MRGRAWVEEELLAQRGALFGWAPVCLSIGIGWYFMLRFEPSMAQFWIVGAFMVVLVLCGRLLGEAFGPIAMGLALVAAGFILAGWRAHDVAGPVLGYRYYGPVEGRVIALDRSASDALRVTLDRVVLERTAPERTPTRVRISLHGNPDHNAVIQPGLRMMTTAHLSPPAGPVEPGGFDFQRHAWFGHLGAVGYSRVPMLAIAAAADGQAGLAVFRLRMAASERILATLPGDVGGFSVAVTTGARSAISQAALDDLRASNLAHLLAISGLHMGLLTGVVFGMLRIGFALVPPLALRLPVRKLSAGGALVAAAGYLALSGGNVATERAFIMAAVALCAIMLNRRAISLRGVAIAALIVLALRPEALLGPGFQMSFAATTALVAVFGWMRDRQFSLGPTWVKPFAAVLISSAVAGVATAPIGAAHFNAISHYGLFANLLSVPVMGAVVVPAAVAAVCLAPFGLESVGLWVMGLGLRWILWVAETVASLDGARSFIPGPGGAVLPLLALGFLWLVLWQGRLRFAGLGPMLGAFVLWGLVERPLALIADNGALVGVMTETGRALSKAKGAGFIAENWLENDGDPTDQAKANARWPIETGARIGTVEVLHIIGKRAVADFDGCAAGQIVVANLDIKSATNTCMFYDPKRLRATGAIAIRQSGDGVVLQSVRDVTGTRLWSQWKD
jgi:competence protein ComEC